MKKKLIVSALTLCMVFSLAACGSDSEEKTSETTPKTEEAKETAAPEGASSEVVEVPVSIVNGTGADLASVRISGAGMDEWGDNQLGGETMAHGTFMNLMLNVDQNNLKWDLSVEDAEGTALNWYDIDISEMPSDGFCIELLWDGNEGTANVVASVSELAGDYTIGGEAASTSEVLAGTAWVDSDYNVYVFSDDGYSMSLTLEDGSEYDGQYALATSTEDGTTVLAMEIPDAGIELQAQLTSINETSIEFTNLASGESATFTPVETE